MKNNYFTFLLSLCTIFTGLAQESRLSKLDSLAFLEDLLQESLNQYDFNSTIENSTRLIQLAGELNDMAYLYRGYRMLGITYEQLEDKARARVNYEKALEYAIKSENDTLLMGAYNNLGNIFSEDPEQVDLGLEYYERAIEYGLKIQDSANVLTPVINIGWTHLDNGDYKKALPYLERGRDLLNANFSKEPYANLTALFGIYYRSTGEIQRSQDFFQEAIRQSEKDSLLIPAYFAFREYSDLLYEVGRYEEAYLALEKHQEYKDMLQSHEKIRQMEAAYARFGTMESNRMLEMAQKEQAFKDEVLKKTREVSMILVISVAVLSVFLMLLVRSNSIRKRLIGQLKDKNNQLYKSKEEAERLSIMKTRFFSTVSHELRTPLYGVVGLTSLMLEDNKDEKQVEDLKSLKFSADYLLALINDVLQMNKMESQLVKLEDIPFDLRDLLQGIIKSFEFARNQNNNEIELLVDERIPQTLIGDSIRMSQILMNLLGNALKFTERGKVWIKAGLIQSSEEHCSIQFEVGDTGFGIPQNKQKEIFEEFSQLNANNFNYQGTGLGLSIVKRLLDLFGSKISLESEEYKGSIFRFKIDFKVGKVQETNGAELAEEAFDPKHQYKALIVDDNRINQVVTQRILERKNVICQVAGDGYQALEMLKASAFDVVLMDVNMPGISGMETTRLIREFNGTLPIIALTAVEVDEMREEILASGMNDIIVKPYDTDQFYNTVFKNLHNQTAVHDDISI